MKTGSESLWVLFITDNPDVCTSAVCPSCSLGGQDADREVDSEVEGGAGPGHEVSRLINAVGVAWEGSITVVRVVADRSVGLITVVGRVIIVVCVRQRCMRRLRSLS